MFDFSGTLMRVEPVERWLGRTLEDAGISGPQAEFAHYATRLETAGALPGGLRPVLGRIAGTKGA